MAVVEYTGFEQAWQDIMEDLESNAPAARLQGLKELARIGYGAEEAAALFNDKSMQVRIGALRAVASMGAMGSSCASRVLQRATNNNLEPEERVAAIEALGELMEAPGGNDAVSPLVTHGHAEIEAAACAALGKCGDKSLAAKLSERLASPHVVVVIGAIKGLAGMKAESGLIAGKATHPNGRVRAAALQGLAQGDAEPLMQHLDLIIKSLEDADFRVREAALACIRLLGSKADSKVAAIAGLLKNSSGGIRCSAAIALSCIGSPALAHVDDLEKLLQDPAKDESMLVFYAAGLDSKCEASLRKVCCAAAVALGTLKVGKAATAIGECLAQTEDTEMKIACLEALAKLGTDGARHQEIIEALIDDSSPVVVAAGLRALGELALSTFPSANAAMKVAEQLEKSHPAVKEAAAWALSCMDTEAIPYVELVVKLLTDVSEKVQIAAIKAVVAAGEMGEMYAVKIVRLMYSQNTAVRLCAIEGMGKMTTRGSAYAEEVETLLKDPDEDVREAALKTLEALQLTPNAAGDEVAVAREAQE